MKISALGKIKSSKYWNISVIFGSLTFNMLLLIPETGNCMPKACLRQFLYALYAFFRVIFGVKEATLTQTDGDVVVLLAQETYAAQAYISCLCVRTHLNWRKACVRIGFHFPANTIGQVTSMLLFLYSQYSRECMELISVTYETVLKSNTTYYL